MLNRRKEWIIIKVETLPEEYMETQNAQNIQTKQDSKADQNMGIQPGQQIQVDGQYEPDELITLQECQLPAKQDHLTDWLESNPYKIDQGYITYLAETLPNL